MMPLAMEFAVSFVHIFCTRTSIAALGQVIYFALFHNVFLYGSSYLSFPYIYLHLSLLVIHHPRLLRTREVCSPFLKWKRNSTVVQWQLSGAASGDHVSSHE